MDRASITICRIYAALNNVLTASLTEEELIQLENDIIKRIGIATGIETKQYDNKSLNQTKNIANTISIENNSPKPTAEKVIKKSIDNETKAQDVLTQANTSQNNNSHTPGDNDSSKKRVRWDCKSCMNISFKDSEENSVCALCKKEFECIGKTNTYYQRRPKDIPSHCGSCNYVKFDENSGRYLCTVNYCESNKIINNIVRANYMNKNKPNFCRM